MQRRLVIDLLRRRAAFNQKEPSYRRLAGDFFAWPANRCANRWPGRSPGSMSRLSLAMIVLMMLAVVSLIDDTRGGTGRAQL
jgi:hypothetical protein